MLAVTKFRLGLSSCIIVTALVSFGSRTIDVRQQLKDFDLRRSLSKLPLANRYNDSHQAHKTQVGFHFKMENQSITQSNVTVIPDKFFQYLASHLFNTSYPGVENYTLYVMAKSKLKPLQGVQPLLQDFGPVLNDVTSFKYPIEISSCSYSVDFRKRTTIFVAIISAVQNFEHRQIIRQTWLNHLRNETFIKGVDLVGYGFIVGLTRNESIQERIEEETKKHADILQLDVMDYYYNLTLKSVGLLNWLDGHCSQVDFVLKVDDDVYVNVRNLQLVITKSLNHSEPSVYGSPIFHETQRGNITFYIRIFCHFSTIILIW